MRRLGALGSGEAYVKTNLTSISNELFPNQHP
jgi:hypothetical protein